MVYGFCPNHNHAYKGCYQEWHERAALIHNHEKPSVQQPLAKPFNNNHTKVKL
jgi:hypothetical protein